jgi:hypothetical protein
MVRISVEASVLDDILRVESWNCKSFSRPYVNKSRRQLPYSTGCQTPAGKTHSQVRDFVILHRQLGLPSYLGLGHFLDRSLDTIEQLLLGVKFARKGTVTDVAESTCASNSDRPRSTYDVCDSRRISKDRICLSHSELVDWSCRSLCKSLSFKVAKLLGTPCSCS